MTYELFTALVRELIGIVGAARRDPQTWNAGGKDRAAGISGLLLEAINECERRSVK